MEEETLHKKENDVVLENIQEETEDCQNNIDYVKALQSEMKLIFKAWTIANGMDEFCKIKTEE